MAKKSVNGTNCNGFDFFSPDISLSAFSLLSQLIEILFSSHRCYLSSFLFFLLFFQRRHHQFCSPRTPIFAPGLQNRYSWTPNGWNHYRRSFFHLAIRWVSWPSIRFTTVSLKPRTYMFVMLSHILSQHGPRNWGVLGIHRFDHSVISIVRAAKKREKLNFYKRKYCLENVDIKFQPLWWHQHVENWI